MKTAKAKQPIAKLSFNNCRCSLYLISFNHPFQHVPFNYFKSAKEREIT